ncbi:MAG: hypothetical protein KUG75_04990, partial [Pseudomonadales bacterium]|nr:hypothetical protein [Pseudomonadales bacterium]
MGKQGWSDVMQKYRRLICVGMSLLFIPPVFAEEPRSSIPEQPRSISEQPRSISEQPRSISEQPRSISE